MTQAPWAGHAEAAVQATPALRHALPKVELHCHLLGAVRRHTFEQLVRLEIQVGALC